MTLWEIDIHPKEGQPDHLSRSVANELEFLRFAKGIQIVAAQGYLIEGSIDLGSVRRAAKELLADPIVESWIAAEIGDPALEPLPSGRGPIDKPILVHVLPKPGVMDPAGLSTQQALARMGLDATAVRTFRKYWLGASAEDVRRISQKVLANDSIEQVIIGQLELDRLQVGTSYEFQLLPVPISQLDDSELMKLSREGQLHLSIAEMLTVQKHYRELGREPTDIELETIAQTWSEHCSHKTLAGRIAYRDENGEMHFENMLKETIFAATNRIRERLGRDDWCVKVFKDNAGIVTFDDDYHVVFKVETHNHPSAIEPYGGANTGIGGVIRDPLGTGLGAKPICNTDVFCFAPPDMEDGELPSGVLHPRKIMTGVVAGVRDYGNRMGIPTVNGAVFFDPRYVGNPLVYCGNVGLLPKGKEDKQALPGDWIVAIGGRTGRDGIHGATFSSVELTHESESISGGSVQIGNAVMEKMVRDALLKARDEGLFHAVTDCGAGGFSSAIGEMGESIGAEVWLEKAPLKYEGLSYTEIWISEAQERMILAVPQDKWDRLDEICRGEGVEATILGQFLPTGLLRLMYQGTEVGCLSMEFLHQGRPPVIRQAFYAPVVPSPEPNINDDRATIESILLKILGSPNVASKHWIIRQYDHEVQAGSVVKPLVGPNCDGPSDAAVVRPRLNSHRGLVISCGMNPCYGDLDTYAMAASAIDEAVRNAIAVGADPSRIALLDNFCWGNTDRAETLGSLVRAALACRDLALAWNMPFISGKDSLNNEFSWVDRRGERKTLSIPPTLLISAIGQIPDVRQSVTMDLKKPGNRIYLLGATRHEMGGSHALLVSGLSGGVVPSVDPSSALRIFNKLHEAIRRGFVRACHDLSEGGLAVAAAEMAFAGNLGMHLQIEALCKENFVDLPVALFSESNSRFLVEVPESCEADWQSHVAELACYRLGEVTEATELMIAAGDRALVQLSLEQLKKVWLAPLDWT